MLAGGVDYGAGKNADSIGGGDWLQRREFQIAERVCVGTGGFSRDGRAGCTDDDRFRGRGYVQIYREFGLLEFRLFGDVDCFLGKAGG